MRRKSLLHIAVVNRAVACMFAVIAQLLLICGCGDGRFDDIKSKDEFQRVLMSCVSTNDVSGVSQLARRKEFDLNFETKIGNNIWTPLTKAAAIGNVKIAKALVNAGAKVDFVDSVKNTPLNQAAWSGNLEMVKYLSRYSADLGCAALFAARAGRLEVVKWMVEKKELSVDYTNHDEKKTCTGVLLAEAAWGGRLNVCRYLLSKGATLDYHPKTSDGRYKYSALERAAQNGQLEVVRYLVEEKGAKLFSAIDLARKERHEEVARYLEQHYAVEIKARKDAAEKAKKEKEDRVLSEYRKLTRRLGWFRGEYGYSEDAEKWARELVRGLNCIDQKHFGASVKTAFCIMSAKADRLLVEVRNEQDARREIAEGKEKLQKQISQNANDSVESMGHGFLQLLCGEKEGAKNFYGGLFRGMNNEQKIKKALAELERQEGHTHDKVSRAYVDYKDAAEVFEKRALQSVE